MNISITNLCNRRCDYCFQKTWYLSNKTKITDDVHEMSLLEFKNLIEWGNSVKFIKLMGGEPLMHSNINGILDIAGENGRDIVIISNISVDEDILNSVINNKYFNNVKSILVNTDYPKSQKEIFIKNLISLCKTQVDISLSSTLLPNRIDLIKSADRLKQLIYIYSKYRDIRTLNIRLSPYCPLPGSKFIAYDYSSDLAEFFNIIWSYGPVNIHFDCTVLDSEINKQATEAYTKAGINIKKLACNGCDGLPFDVLVDGSIIWCSSCNYIKLDNYKNYKNFEEAKIALIEKWKLYCDTVKDSYDPNSSFCIAKEICKNEIPIKMFK